MRKSIQREKAVLVYGDNGLETVRENDAVGVAVMPIGEGGACIPATMRFLAGSDPGRVPRRLTGVRRKKVNGKVRVTFRTANGERWTCFLRHELDARDPVFSSLPDRSRARLLAAVA